LSKNTKSSISPLILTLQRFKHHFWNVQISNHWKIFCSVFMSHWCNGDATYPIGNQVNPMYFHAPSKTAVENYEIIFKIDLTFEAKTRHSNQKFSWPNPMLKLVLNKPKLVKLVDIDSILVDLASSLVNS